jgi:hypothetical protein
MKLTECISNQKQKITNKSKLKTKIILNEGQFVRLIDRLKADIDKFKSSSING